MKRPSLLFTPDQRGQKYMPDHRPEILTDAEWSALSILPEDDLIEVAADLDLVVDKHINHRALWNKCVWAILFRANTEGLPLSEYDAEDVALLSTEQRTAIAKLQGGESRPASS